MDFDEEQMQMVNLAKNLSPPKGKTLRKNVWNKFFGDATNRIVIKFLAKHLPSDCEAIGPGAYIEGIPNEFDIVIINRQVEPIKFTNAYPRNSVSAVVEVKRTGVFHNKREAENRMQKQLEGINSNLQGIPFLYITFHESEKLMEITRYVYGDRAFFLSTRTKYSKVLTGEWKRFVEAIVNIQKERTMQRVIKRHVNSPSGKDKCKIIST